MYTQKTVIMHPGPSRNSSTKCFQECSEIHQNMFYKTCLFLTPFAGLFKRGLFAYIFAGNLHGVVSVSRFLSFSGDFIGISRKFRGIVRSF